MMKLHSFLIVLFAGYALCDTISRVHLIDHTSYMLEVMTRTVNSVENAGWCNLKLSEYVHQLNETLVDSHAFGTAKYTNGFLVSIQHLDIERVQQVWAHNRVTGITTVTVRGTLRMYDVAVGYDVEVDLTDGKHQYTTIFVHPLISYVFSVIKNVITETIEVTVVGTVPNTNRIPTFSPIDNTTDILTSMFIPATVTSASIIAWGSEVFQPIVYDLVMNQIPFPLYCYDCSQ